MINENLQPELPSEGSDAGQFEAPPPDIIFHILGQKFGMWPEQVASLPVEEVLKAWQLHAEMTPKEKR